MHRGGPARSVPRAERDPDPAATAVRSLWKAVSELALAALAVLLLLEVEGELALAATAVRSLLEAARELAATAVRSLLEAAPAQCKGCKVPALETVLHPRNRRRGDRFDREQCGIHLAGPRAGRYPRPGDGSARRRSESRLARPGRHSRPGDGSARCQSESRHARRGRRLARRWVSQARVRSRVKRRPSLGKHKPRSKASPPWVCRYRAACRRPVHHSSFPVADRPDRWRTARECQSLRRTFRNRISALPLKVPLPRRVATRAASGCLCPAVPTRREPARPNRIRCRTRVPCLAQRMVRRQAVRAIRHRLVRDRRALVCVEETKLRQRVHPPVS